MIGHIVDDTLKFLFVYFLLFVPYVCAFWIIFGGSSNAAIMKKASQPTTSWEKFNDLVYTVSQITVVGRCLLASSVSLAIVPCAVRHLQYFSSSFVAIFSSLAYIQK